MQRQQGGGRGYRVCAAGGAWEAGVGRVQSVGSYAVPEPLQQKGSKLSELRW
ncbi:uncharacterized protein ASCRUDRAFT_74087 [Ascoidea rubescens DSM 1968]|uniref:Uncharacterized protein n=1 Tax=Ascoidea rubescens DSM 1968 TaxID=1344418 RepID=A0A1D2VS77_9ASCO|nr:hypothetical protein ASCRUDRAFT_74087 [Ascoidea rubescens DSM 1968]ODV64472.1 hypothetical protein ASCRUDRAFT_74087 [Ascoidea rubescens DSM 1968]